jgi:outer membrane protein assembly factor BamB
LAGKLDGENSVWALDAATGELLWSFPLSLLSPVDLVRF